MRFAKVSDTHPEIKRIPVQKIHADILAMIGDNGSTPAEVRESVLEHYTHSPKMKILVILGNHEAHGLIWEDYIEQYREALKDIPGVFFLEDESIEIDGYTFVGSTLWTKLDPIAAIAIQQTLEDYRPTGIRSHDGRGGLVAINPEQINARHNASLRYIESVLRSCEDPSRVVILTHHAPSLQSWTHRDGPLSDRLKEAYCNNLDRLIEGYSPLMWCHGHLHESQNYEIGETNINCNPQGYSKIIAGNVTYGNENFDPHGDVVDLEILRERRQNVNEKSISDEICEPTR